MEGEGGGGGGRETNSEEEDEECGLHRFATQTEWEVRGGWSGSVPQRQR